MKDKLLLIFLFNYVLIQAQVERDSIVNKYLNQINPDSIVYFIQKLQDFGTRYVLAENKQEVVNWIANKFHEYGYQVEIDSFKQVIDPWGDSIITYPKNIIATLTGLNPDEVVMTGAHYDSWSHDDPMHVAPGADDNASGTAAVLETARVLQNYKADITFKFIAFDAEESGEPSGSMDYAAKAYDAGMDIKLLLNHDMIGHNTNPMDSSYIGTYYLLNELKDINHKDYNEFTKLITNYFSKLKVKSFHNIQQADASHFAALGYPAVSFAEDQFGGAHTANDVLENLNIEYCTEVIKASCATLLAAAEMTEARVNNFRVWDGGDGQSIVLTWSPDINFIPGSYAVYIGTEYEDFDTSFTTTDTVFTIDNLRENTLYYLRITQKDSRGYEGFVQEGIGIPHSLPMAPSGIIDEPQTQQVKLMWRKNVEYDLKGYNIYRSTTPGGEEILLNSVPLTDTFYVDESAQKGYYYYYTIKAVDIENNESLQNETIRSRVISLDQGILLVDESTDGSGTIMNPTDEQTDSFYNSLLPDFNNKNYDVITEGGIKLADLGAFSTILWHNGDLLSSARIESDMRKYLDYGGKLLFTGYIPSKVFSSNYSTYPKDFEPGDFVYDYLKISGTDLTFGSRFRAGIGQTGYPDIFTDSGKTKQEQLYHLTNIESITAVPGAVTNYLYDTQYDTLSSYGKMKGMPVGVEYLGDDFKVVALSFPLYYMNYDQAKELVNYILLEKFDEITSAEEEREDKFIPEEYYLFQNYPNPFNPNTTIKYQIPVNGLVRLKIYDILGKEISTLVNEEKSAGRYEVNFNASDLASGVYIYRVKVNEFVESKKMVLMK